MKHPMDRRQFLLASLTEDGAYPVPDRPGLGYTLNRDSIAKYFVEQHTFE